MERDPIQTLETAAQILMVRDLKYLNFCMHLDTAPPSQVSVEQRREAEAVFHEFRASRGPYALCRELLERPSSQLVLFEAAALLKGALVREWDSLAAGDVAALRTYLFNYLQERDVPPFLREKLLQTIAIIIKRGGIEDGGAERRALLAQLEQTVAGGAPRQQRLACGLLLALMQEYAITVKSADVGLIWEVHFLAKKHFEAIDLKRIFRFAVGMLEQVVRSGQRPEGERATLTRQLLSITEAVLCWGQVSPLLPKRLIGAFEAVYESDSAPALRLSSNWKDTILQPELVGLFFDLHLLVRADPELATPSLTCLVQLASLSGFVFNNKTVKQAYLENYVSRFLPLVCAAPAPGGRELLGVADVFRRLVQFFTPTMLAALPPALLDRLTDLTCHCMRGAVAEEGRNDDTVWREALSRLLDTWSALVHDGEFPRDTLRTHAAPLLNTYLQARLAPPDGTRGVESSDGCGDDVNDDMEEDDRKLHSAVLVTLGAIARLAPAHSCHMLYTLLRDRSHALEAQLQLLHAGKLPVSGGEQLVSLFEDLHWILMITGHFLAVDCTEGETVLMPPELIQFSLEEKCDVEASLRHLVGDAAPADNVDPVLRLVTEVLRLSAWEGAALAAGLGSAFSPELSATLSWLLKIWANSYLMPKQSLYSEMSHLFECAWGVQSAGAAWALARLVARASASLRHLHAQPAPAHQACQLLLTLAHIEDKQGRLANCEEFLALVAWEAAGSNLSGELRRELHKAFAVATTYAEGEARARLLASPVALRDKLRRLLAAADDAEPARAALADTIDCFIGVAEGVHEVSRMDEQYTLLSEALEKVPGIVFRYHNYPAVVLPCLNLLARSAKRMLHSLEPHNADRFYEVCCSVLEVYSRCIAGRVSALASDTEEDAYQDICVLMELVSSVGRCAEWAVGGAAGGGGGAARVCSRGLRLLLPLVTPPLLLLPTLARAAYRMLRDLDNADQICPLPIEEFNCVIEALHVGLKAVSSDVAALCCDTVVGLAGRVRALGEDGARAHSLLTLAPLLLTLIIKMEISAEALPAAGAAVYALTCVRPALLDALARQLVEGLARADAPHAPRLERAFADLAAGVLFDGARHHKLRFRDNFDKFLVNVHGFLVVK